MKPFLYCALSLITGASILAAEATSEFADDKDKLSYALGANFGGNIKGQEIEVNLDTVIQGVKDAMEGQPKLNQAEMTAIFQQLRSQLLARQEQKKAENKAAGEKWLAENAQKSDVTKLDSGLQYKVIKEGTGESPKPTDEVQVKYTGKLLDGTVFDSTENGDPRKFRLNAVIPGWTEGMQKMKEGAIYEFYIPSDLAYGERGRPGIPPNSVLIFNVELLDVIPGPTPSASAARPGQPVTSDIIKVPSAEELKKGAQIEIIKPEDLEKEIEKEKARKAAEGNNNP